MGSNEAESAVLMFSFLDHEAHPFSCFLAMERALSVQGPLPLLSEPYSGFCAFFDPVSERHGKTSRWNISNTLLPFRTFTRHLTHIPRVERADESVLSLPLHPRSNFFSNNSIAIKDSNHVDLELGLNTSHSQGQATYCSLRTLGCRQEHLVEQAV